MIKTIQVTTNRTLALILLGVVVTVVTLLLCKPVHAQEITPAPDTYAFGSTSELSPYSVLPPAATAVATLAPTGQDQNIGYLVAIASLVAASLISVQLVQTHRKKIQ